MPPPNAGKGYEVVYFPDLPPAGPDVDERDQYAVMVDAAKKRGGLKKGEDLTALPSGTPSPQGWKRERSITSPTTKRKYDVYTRQRDVQAPEVMEFSDDEGLTVTGKQPGTPGPAGEALDDIDENFSPSDGPADTTADCIENFAEGFVEGAVVGYVMGLVLGLLGPVGLAIGAGLMLYGAYELITNWDKMSPAEKSRAIGGLFGGLVGGGLGAKHAGKLGTVGELPPGETLKPGQFRDANGRLRNADGKFAKEPANPGGRLSRRSEYPSKVRPDVRERVIARNKNAQGEIIDPETGEVIPPDQVTIEHKRPVVKHWNDEGYNQTPEQRADWYNDESNLSVKSKSKNSSDGAKLGETYKQTTGPDYRSGRE